MQLRAQHEREEKDLQDKVSVRRALLEEKVPLDLSVLPISLTSLNNVLFINEYLYIVPLTRYNSISVKGASSTIKRN